MLNVSIVAKRANILPTAQYQEKMTMNSQTWYPSRISKTISIFIERNVLNYARSRNPSGARTHTHRQIQAPREPLN
jgi:hypothetical protein